MNLVRAFFPKSGHFSLNFEKGQGGPLFKEFNFKEFFGPLICCQIEWLIIVGHVI